MRFTCDESKRNLGSNSLEKFQLFYITRKCLKHTPTVLIQFPEDYGATHINFFFSSFENYIYV